MKLKHVCITATIVAVIISCTKEKQQQCAPFVENTLAGQNDETELINLMLNASVRPDVVNAMNSVARASLEAGLEESVYLDEILDDSPLTKTLINDNTQLLRNYFNEYLSLSTKSGDEDVIRLDNIEIYWPYSDNWDGISQPVIVFNQYDDSQYIEEDKTYAYRFIPQGDSYSAERIIVDEAYAESNPVWIIGVSDISLEDIVNQKNGDYEKTNIVPRNVSTKADNVCELIANTLKSTKQHDDWVNGGSEYIIYWFFPDNTNTVRENHTAQIKMSRKEIKNGTVRTIDFTGNFDWSIDQRYNKIKVIEFDPGGNKNIPIELSAKINNATVTLKTTISVNDNDEMVMEYEIPRQSMFTVNTKVDATHYTKTFYGDGVYVKTTLSAIEALAEL